MHSEIELREDSNHQGLQSYHLEEDVPDNWQSMIAQLHRDYLAKSSAPKNLTETLRSLKNLIIASDYYPDKSAPAVLSLSFGALGLHRLYVLLQDPGITEIFGNILGRGLVISHTTYGRCRTNIIFSEELWNSVSLRAEYDTGLPLNNNHPALKFGLETELGQLRISLQVPPLSVGGPIFTLRRLPKKAISLSTLVTEGQISRIFASILLEAIISRRNIVIAGEPGSGKTTLANALLKELEPWWRLIILEDAREISLNPDEFPLMTHYHLPAVGASNRSMNRSDEIARLLHRSPDYVFLGELQNREDTQVSFEAFAAGIRGMATTHARSIEGLFQRWNQSHGLPKELIQSVDLIVLTSRIFTDGIPELGIRGVYTLENGELTEIDA